MYNYFKYEFRRVLFSKNSFICFFITLFVILFALINNITLRFQKIYLFKEQFDFIDMFLFSRNGSSTSILPLIAPLLASLIFSDSYLIDRNSGFLKYIYLRLDKKKYIITRLLVNSICSGLIILLSSLTVLIFLICLYGTNINPTNPLGIAGPFNYLYYNNKLIYCIIILVVSFIFNMIFSTLSLGISTIITNKYLAFLAPFFYYILSGTLFIMLKLYKLNATYLFVLKSGHTEINLISYQLILIIIGILLFYLGVLYRNEKDL